MEHQIEKAERITRKRAILLLMLALILIILAVIGYSKAIFPSAIATWAVLALLVAANLTPLHARLRRDGLGRLMEDEVTAANRKDALVAGFWALIAATLALGLIGDTWHLDSFSGARMVMSAGLATALTVFAARELRSLRD